MDERKNGRKNTLGKCCAVYLTVVPHALLVSALVRFW